MTASASTPARPPSRDQLLGRAIQRYMHSPFSDDLISPPQDIIVEISSKQFEFANPIDLERNPRCHAALLRPLYGRDVSDCQIVTNFIAWEAGAPWVWWRWDAERDPVIGLDYLALCQARDQPCVAVDTPAEWAEAMLGNAICVLDWEQLDTRLLDGLAVRASAGFEKRYARRKRGRWQSQRPRFQR